MNTELMEALDMLEKEKDISRDTLFDAFLLHAKTISVMKKMLRLRLTERPENFCATHRKRLLKTRTLKVMIPQP